MLVMKHWKCNIVPEDCKTSHKTRTILEAQKRDSLVHGTEERKKWIDNLLVLGLCSIKATWDSPVNKGREEVWSRELPPGCGWCHGTAPWQCCREHRAWDLTQPFTKFKWRISGLRWESGAVLSLKVLQYNNSLLLFEQGFRHFFRTQEIFLFLFGISKIFNWCLSFTSWPTMSCKGTNIKTQYYRFHGFLKPFLKAIFFKLPWQIDP